MVEQEVNEDDLYEKWREWKDKQDEEPEFDEFEYADQYNDGNKECDICKKMFIIEDLDKVDDMWICKGCENKKNFGERNETNRKI